MIYEVFKHLINIIIQLLLSDLIIPKKITAYCTLKLKFYLKYQKEFHTLFHSDVLRLFVEIPTRCLHFLLLVLPRHRKLNPLSHHTLSCFFTPFIILSMSWHKNLHITSCLSSQITIVKILSLKLEVKTKNSFLFNDKSNRSHFHSDENL